MSRDILKVKKRSQTRHFVPVGRIDEFWGTDGCDTFEGLLEAKQILSWSVEKIKPGALYVLFDPQKCCRIVITVGAAIYQRLLQCDSEPFRNCRNHRQLHAEVHVPLSPVTRPRLR
jgi:hypothetical protein